MELIFPFLGSLSQNLLRNSRSQPTIDSIKFMKWEHLEIYKRRAGKAARRAADSLRCL